MAKRAPPPSFLSSINVASIRSVERARRVLAIKGTYFSTPGGCCEGEERIYETQFQTPICLPFFPETLDNCRRLREQLIKEEDGVEKEDEELNNTKRLRGRRKERSPGNRGEGGGEGAKTKLYLQPGATAHA